MNTLAKKQQIQVLTALVEGCSLRATARLTGVSLCAVKSLHIRAGKVAQEYHHRHIRRVRARYIQCDEIWSFCYAKRQRVSRCVNAPPEAGDAWTWTAIDAKSKLMIAWYVGLRTRIDAKRFMADVARRIHPEQQRVQITTDGFRAYKEAVLQAFGRGVNYAQVIGPNRKRVICGRPYPPAISTVHVERQNLNMRMGMRRMTRKTNGFSKKLANHQYMTALYFWYYNFCRIHQSLRVTPAMAAGIDDQLHDIGWMVDIIRANDPEPGPRGPYKSRRYD